jgi:hypothetical protein
MPFTGAAFASASLAITQYGKKHLFIKTGVDLTVPASLILKMAEASASRPPSITPLSTKYNGIEHPKTNSFLSDKLI